MKCERLEVNSRTHLTQRAICDQIALFFWSGKIIMSSRLISQTPVTAACQAVLHLSGIKGLGLKSFHQLHRYFGSAEAILNASRDELTASGIKPRLVQAIEILRSVDVSAADPRLDLLLDWLQSERHHLICLEDPGYPVALLEIFCPPPLLYIKGNLSVFSPSSIAVVGSRRPTLGGQRNAYRFGRELAENQVVVTSGLAIGVDTYAHQGVLSAAGIGCAVLGSGLDCVYPRQNQSLAEALCERGALVSEQALGVPAAPSNFPRRNRIISGLSSGVLVVEAGVKSGSLITASFALEQNRDVFAIPGPIDSTMSGGCHALIKQGGMLVETVEDILQTLSTAFPLQRSADCNAKADAKVLPEGLTTEELRLINLIGRQVVSFDELMFSMSMAVSDLTNLLMSLELKGILSSAAGGYQRL
jgi:DNA processing protein